MFNRFKNFATSLVTRVVVGAEEGQTMVEYALIIAIVSIGVIGLLAALGTDIGTVFTKIGTELEKA